MKDFSPRPHFSRENSAALEITQTDLRMSGCVCLCPNSGSRKECGHSVFNSKVSENIPKLFAAFYLHLIGSLLNHFRESTEIVSLIIVLFYYHRLFYHITRF